MWLEWNGWDAARFDWSGMERDLMWSEGGVIFCGRTGWYSTVHGWLDEKYDFRGEKYTVFRWATGGYKFRRKGSCWLDTAGQVDGREAECIYNYTCVWHEMERRGPKPGFQKWEFGRTIQCSSSIAGLRALSLQLFRHRYGELLYTYIQDDGNHIHAYVMYLRCCTSHCPLSLSYTQRITGKRRLSATAWSLLRYKSPLLVFRMAADCSSCSYPFCYCR